MTIKVLEKTEGCFPQEFKIGDYIDLSTADDIVLKAPQAHKMHVRSTGKNPSHEVRTRDVEFFSCLIPLGVAMKIPAGYEAILVPRSSTFKNWGIIQTNSEGIIDCSFCGNNDEWKLPVIATRTLTIPKGTRIAQFRIQLKQQATIWQKLHWLFSSKVKLKKVNNLGNPSRGGIGEGTGNKNQSNNYFC